MKKHTATELKMSNLDRETKLRKRRGKDVFSELLSVSFNVFQALIAPEIKESLCKTAIKKRLQLQS